MAFDPRAYHLYWTALTQANNEVAKYQQLVASTRDPRAKAMYQAALRQAQTRQAAHQQNVKRQEGAFPVQINEAQYGQAKADINQQFGGQLAAHDYGQQVAQQRHARQAGDFNIAARRQREGADANYLRRGIFQSGIRQAGLGRLREDQLRGYGALTEGHAQELGNLAQQRAGLLTQQQSQLNAIDRQRQQAVFNRLQQLQGYR